MKKCGFVLVFLVSVFASVFISCSTAEDYLDRGARYYNNGIYELALADFNKAIELDPTLAGAYYNRGLVFYKTGKTDGMYRAIKEFEQALQIDPNFIRAGNANAYIGHAYYIISYNENASDYEKARYYANKSLEIENDNETALWIIAQLDKKDAENANLAKIPEIQSKVDDQFAKVDKSNYKEVMLTNETVMMILMGGASPFQVGEKYKTKVLRGLDTPYGATFVTPPLTFVDEDKRVLAELIDYQEINRNGFFIYFTIKRKSGNDHYISLEYIELPK